MRNAWNVRNQETGITFYGLRLWITQEEILL